jgi:hypothetical protein
MEKIKVLVNKVENSSGMVCLASANNIKISEELSFERGKVFYSVTPEIFKEMKKPKAVNVYLQNGLLFAEPIL